MKIVFIGYGNMGRALGAAWQQSERHQVIAVDPLFEASPASYGYAAMEACFQAHALETVDLVILAVKPGSVADALKALPPQGGASTTLVSVAAGVRLAALASYAPPGMPVVRAMPNTPSQLRAGCAALVADSNVTSEIKDEIHGLFELVGAAYWLEDEAQIDMVTAISGSGPAYYHLFTESLMEAGLALGLPTALAQGLAAQTAWGSAVQQHQPGAHFASLRKAVTSPNGTTAAALQVFEKDAALRTLVLRAAEAAHQRSIELSAA